MNTKKMEYLEKTKYELIMALKNEENEQVINFLKEYYNNLIKIITMKNNIFENELSVKYILSIIKKEDNEAQKFCFTTKHNVLDFYEKKIKEIIDYERITIIEIHDINPDGIYRPNLEQNFHEWLK